MLTPAVSHITRRVPFEKCSASDVKTLYPTSFKWNFRSGVSFWVSFFFLSFALFLFVLLRSVLFCFVSFRSVSCRLRFRPGALRASWHGFRQISVRAVLSMESSADRAFRSFNPNRGSSPSTMTVDDADGRFEYSPGGRAYQGSESEDEETEGRKQARVCETGSFGLSSLFPFVTLNAVLLQYF